MTWTQALKPTSLAQFDDCIMIVRGHAHPHAGRRARSLAQANVCAPTIVCPRPRAKTMWSPFRQWTWSAAQRFRRRRKGDGVLTQSGRNFNGLGYLSQRDELANFCSRVTTLWSVWTLGQVLLCASSRALTVERADAHARACIRVRSTGYNPTRGRDKVGLDALANALMWCVFGSQRVGCENPVGRADGNGVRTRLEGRERPFGVVWGRRAGMGVGRPVTGIVAAQPKRAYAYA